MDATNRLGLLLLGLVLLATGGVGLASAYETLRLPEPSVLAATSGDAVTSNPELWWPLILVVAALLVMLGLRLAWRELVARPGVETSELTLDRGDRGTTRVSSRALERAVDDDFTRQVGVTGSRTRLVAAGSVPVIMVRLDVAADADLAAVRGATEPVYDRLSRALGVEELRADLRLRPIGAPARVA